MLHERVRDLGQGNAEDVQLARLDEVQEELERALEDRQVHLECLTAHRDWARRIQHDGDRLERHQFSLPRLPRAARLPGARRQLPASRR